MEWIKVGDAKALWEMELGLSGEFHKGNKTKEVIEDDSPGPLRGSWHPWQVKYRKEATCMDWSSRIQVEASRR